MGFNSAFKGLRGERKTVAGQKEEKKK